jgi:hypothetical protein
MEEVFSKKFAKQNLQTINKHMNKMFTIAGQ